MDQLQVHIIIIVIIIIIIIIILIERGLLFALLCQKFILALSYGTNI